MAVFRPPFRLPPPTHAWIPGVPASGINGDLSATEADDTLSATGTLLIQGVLSGTEANDTLAGDGTVLVQGALSSTEADDTLAGTGVIGSTITGTLDATEADDTLSASGTVLVQGALVGTEADDTLGGTGTALIQGAASATEGDDTLSATGTVLVQGSLSATEADDSLLADGVVGSLPTITGTASITEQDDSLVATGAVPVEGVLGGRGSRGLLDLDTDDHIRAVDELHEARLKQRESERQDSIKKKPAPTEAAAAQESTTDAPRPARKRSSPVLPAEVIASGIDPDSAPAKAAKPEFSTQDDAQVAAVISQAEAVNDDEFAIVLAQFLLAA